MSKRKQNKTNKIIYGLIFAILVVIIGFFSPELAQQLAGNLNSDVAQQVAGNLDIDKSNNNQGQNEVTYAVSAEDLASIPEYDSSPYVILNNNKPEFTEEKLNSEEFESYSDLDALGRCGVAMANIGLNLMPDADEERESISNVEPTGWINKEYDIVDGGYLYNRCHLIGYQLTAENANEKNLITGTRYMNTEGMLPFENEIAEYIKETRNHVLYRVTPIFEDDNLVASGVQLEAQSIEDDGDGVCFNVYCYNVQPGIIIDYATGESREA